MVSSGEGPIALKNKLNRVKIDFGYSPCPNDTFMFWAWAHDRLTSELSLNSHLHDIQKLNRLALEDGGLAFTKVSMAAFLEPEVQAHYRLLSAGAALGRGCGPLVVSKKPWSPDRGALRLAIPGRNTTAYKLARMALGPWVEEWVELRYDEILSAVLEGEKVDAGVIIHESRFVYRELGLECAFDLGDWWEKETGLPLPLGVMVARKSVDEKTVAEVEKNLVEGIALAHRTIGRSTADPDSESLWGYLRSNATELDDHTMRSHIELYVNEYSLDLGEEGEAAVAEFGKRAKSAV
jgi:1,4-dihydroxy-6-naphthoate synthase